MSIYKISIILIIVLSFILKKFKNKKKIFCVTVWLLLTCIIGLRYIYMIRSDGLSDIYVYQNNYYVLKNYSFSEAFSFNNYKAPIFYILMSIFSKNGVTFQFFIFLITAFSMAIIMRYFYLYSSNALISVFVYLGMGGFVFSFYLLRQMMSVTFILLAFEMYKKNNWKKLSAYSILAILVHRYSVIAILLFFMDKVKLKKITIYLYITLTVVFLMFRIQIARFMVGIFGGNYLGRYHVSGGIGGLAVFYLLFLTIYIFLYIRYFVEDEYKEERFLLNGMILLSIIQICASYSYAFTRLNFFINTAVFTILLPKCLNPQIIKRKISNNGNVIYLIAYVFVIMVLTYMYFAGLTAEGIDRYIFFWEA